MADQRAPWAPAVEAITEAELERIPPAYRVPCALCGRDVDVRAVGVHQLVTGWWRLRGRGGGLAMREPLPHWAHSVCVELAVAGKLHQARLEL